MKRLRIEYWVIWLSCLVLQLLFTRDVFSQGVVSNPQTQYVLGTMVVLFTLGLIYGCLRLFSLKTVKDDVKAQGFRAYRRWAEFRTMGLGTVCILDLLFYHFTLESLGGFCCLISLIAMLFIFPSQKELDRMTASDDDTSTAE